MNKLRKMCLIVFIPIVLGVALIIIGSFADNETAYYVGVMILSVGIPVTMFVLIVIGLILIITGRLDLSDDKANSKSTKRENKGKDSKWEVVEDESAEETPSERAREYTDLAEINTSHHYRNRDKNAQYVARHTANMYKQATKKEKVLSWLFFGFLVTDFALIMVFGFLDIFIGAIICMCVFGGTLIIALIVKLIVEKVSMSASKNNNGEVFDGVVKACYLSSTRSTGGVKKHSTIRINKVVYRVVIYAADSEYTAYTETFFETGERVRFCKIGKSLASIVDNDDPDLLRDNLIGE